MNTSPIFPSSFGSLRQVLAAVSLFWLAEFASQRLYYGAGSGFSVWGLQWLLAATMMSLAGLAVGCQIAGQAQQLGRLIVTLFLMGSVTGPLLWFVDSTPLGQSAKAMAAVMTLAQFGPPMLAVFWWIEGRGWGRLGRIVVVLACYLLAQALQGRLLSFEPLFYPQAPDDADYVPLDIEALYLAQPKRLEAQINGLAAQDPSKPEVYGLLLGGTADQSVFLNEVEQGGRILGQVYGARGRMLQLANSDDAPERYPLANRTNLEAALTALAGKVGKEDLLFLYLTSHGREDVFSLEFGALGTTALTAHEFAAILERAKVGPAVIVLSACHAGSFIDELAAPDRLILTAAAADRTSFGCRDGGDWTDFGRAFIAESLPVDPDPRRAFAAAIKVIDQRETEQGLRHSLPQISEGAQIGAVIEAVLKALPSAAP